MDREAEQLIQAAMMTQPPAAVQAQMTPLNDTQLVAMVAGQLVGPSMDPKEAVDMALEIVAEAVVQMGPQGVALRQRIKNKIEALRPQ